MEFIFRPSINGITHLFPACRHIGPAYYSEDAAREYPCDLEAARLPSPLSSSGSMLGILYNFLDVGFLFFFT